MGRKNYAPLFKVETIGLMRSRCVSVARIMAKMNARNLSDLVRTALAAQQTGKGA
jgi:FixJ family two-component response regulator